MKATGLLLLGLILLQAHANAEDLGRLFSSADERLMMDAAQKKFSLMSQEYDRFLGSENLPVIGSGTQKIQEEILPPPTLPQRLILNAIAFIQGRPQVWINGQNVRKKPITGVEVLWKKVGTHQLQVKVAGQILTLKLHQSLDLTGLQQQQPQEGPIVDAMSLIPHGTKLQESTTP